jgi:thiopurine S-methyltransferase
MENEAWHARWRDSRIGFHQSQIAQPLTQFWPTLNLPADSTVFVPLCGKSLDLSWLRDVGHAVVGVELSQIALESFFLEHGIPARRDSRPGFDEYLAPGIRLLCGDFFALTSRLLEPYAAIYDRASLIAMPPELQGRYVEKLAELSPSGTQTLLVTIEYPQREMPGPPFSVDSLSVARLYSVDHKIRELSRADILASDLKLSTRLSRLHEVCYHLIRK